MEVVPSLSLYNQQDFSNPGDTFLVSPRCGFNIVRVLVHVASFLRITAGLCQEERGEQVSRTTVVVTTRRKSQIVEKKRF